MCMCACVGVCMSMYVSVHGGGVCVYACVFMPVCMCLCTCFLCFLSFSPLILVSLPVCFPKKAKENTWSLVCGLDLEGVGGMETDPLYEKNIYISPHFSLTYSLGN